MSIRDRNEPPVEPPTEPRNCSCGDDAERGELFDAFDGEDFTEEIINLEGDD